MNAIECVGRVYRMDGLRGFYRGMSASYAGISETVIHFVIYESIKRRLSEFKANSSMDEEEESVKNASDFVGMMLAAATSKTCATSIAYPHGTLPPPHVVFISIRCGEKQQMRDAPRTNCQFLPLLPSRRGDPHTASRRRQQVSLFFPNAADGAQRGGLRSAVPRSHHPPCQTDPKHCNHDVHL